MKLRKESAASSPVPTRIFYWSLQSGSLNATFSVFLNTSPPPQGAQARLRLPHLPRKRKPAVISREATAVIWDQEEQSIHRPTSPSILGKFPGRQDGKAVCSTVCIFEANPTAVADVGDDGCGGVSDAAAGAVPVYLLPLSNRTTHPILPSPVWVLENRAW